MPKKAKVREEDLYRRVVEIIEAARGHVARSVNSAMVHAYWLIGCEIVEVEQQGKERAAYGERLIESLGVRLSERFGKGFCFVARQKRLTLDGDHFHVDLVFYNRLLQCFVLVDLKLGKLTHQDLGQMMMYVNWFDRFQRAGHEQPTVGIVLCSQKNDAVVKISLPDDNRRILAARYQHYLPTEEELRAEVTRSRDEVEHRLRLRGGAPETKATPRSKRRR